MKTKHWIYLSIACLLPVMLSTLMILMICSEWMLVDSGTFGKMFIEGTFNRPFATVLFFVGLIGLSIIFTTLIQVLPKATDIDDLQKAQRDAYLAKLKYNEATRKVVENLH